MRWSEPTKNIVKFYIMVMDRGCFDNGIRIRALLLHKLKQEINGR